jgi:hypothetical protein
MKKLIFVTLVALALGLIVIGCAVDNNPLDKNKSNDSTSHLVIPPVDSNATFTPDNTPSDTQKQIAQDKSDSCLNAFEALVRTLDSVNTVNEFLAKDFVGCRSCFERALEIDPMNTQANLGYSLASLMSLNADPKVATMAESLDVFASGFSTPTAKQAVF